MSANLPAKLHFGEPQAATQLGPEFFLPSTGGRPPRVQVPYKARRKSDAVRGNLTPSPPPEVSEFHYAPLQHQIFKDHRGNDGISVWHGEVRKEGTENLMPPPWNYQVYVTYGDTASSQDIVHLCIKLYDYILYSTTDYLFAGLRFDFIFFPEGSPSACMKHYRAEKRARVATDLALVPTYATEGMGALDCKERNMLLMLNNEDIREKGMKLLQFDAESDEEPEPESEVPEGINRLPNRHRFYEEPTLPETGWIGEPIEDLYRFSTIRATIEREYRTAKASMEREE